MENKLSTSAADFNMDPGTTKDFMLNQFKPHIGQTRMPKMVDAPVEELQAIQGSLKSLMILMAREHWVDTGLYQLLSSLPKSDDGYYINQNTMDPIKGMLVDHASDHCAMSRMTTASYANITLMLRDQVIQVLKNAEHQPATSSGRPSSSNPLQHAVDLEWEKLRMSALSTPDLFDKKQVDAMLAGVQEQVKATQNLSTMVTAVRGATQRSFPATGSSRKRKSNPSRTEQFKAKRPRVEHPKDNFCTTRRSTPPKEPLLRLQNGQPRPGVPEVTASANWISNWRT